MTGSDDSSLFDRLGRLDRRRTATAAMLAFVPAVYLSWLLADFGLRTPGFILGAVAFTWFLLRRAESGSMGPPVLRLLAGLILVTPVFLVLPFLLNAGRFGVGHLDQFVLTEAELVTVIVFVVIAAIPVAIARWVDRAE